MKVIRQVRVVYRNKFFYALRRFLPKYVIIGAFKRGVWSPCVIRVGEPTPLRVYSIRPSSLLDAIVFVYLVKRG
jgi:hypothetical protein